jgi:hypothetical protein
MNKSIFTKSITLHVNNKKLPPLTIQEADEYLHELSESLEDNQDVTVNIEVLFTNGVKLSEVFIVTKTDDLIEHIIRYHMVGIIRFKSGLLTSSTVDPFKYKNDLANVDTDFYKDLFENYSFFYSKRKMHNRNAVNDDLSKFRNKYAKLIVKEQTRIDIHKSKIKYYEGILAGLDISQNQEDDTKITYTNELNALRSGTDKYQYVAGVIEGIELAQEA